MRNPASPGGTPSQHNSTISISPFMVNRTARIQPQQQAQSNMHPPTIGNPVTLPNPNNASNPYQTLINSPLGQKLNKNANMYSSTVTPSHSKRNPATLTSNPMISQGISIGGQSIPSTLPKNNIGRKSSVNVTLENIDSAMKGTDTMASIPESTATATVVKLTTNSAPVTTLNEIDVSELTSIERLRLWRHDALMQHMYTTAEYVGDKIYSITNDPNDAFWLAQVFYNKNEYQRAIDLLATTANNNNNNNNNNNINTSDDVDVLSGSTNNLISLNIMCRYLLGLCLLKLQKFEEALDIVGDTNQFADDSISTDALVIQQKQQTDGGIKLGSSLCFLRGKIYYSMNNFERAKDSFKEAVQVDVKNFEAFETLIGAYLLTPREEWDFINELDFSILGDNEEIIKNFYTLRLSKLVNTKNVEQSQELLSKEYNLETNVELTVSQIDIFYIKCKFSKCLDMCEQYLSRDSFNPRILPIYITCLYELSAKNKLFLLSHKLAEASPKSPITWFSVATYYMTMNKVFQARKFFSKASILDPTFAPAWLGFAHTYALEGEQDQALAAYSTAARFFPGSHLPYLFLGMQYMSSNTLSLAEEYFNLSYDICPTDPLLLNEMGCLYYKKEEFEKSKKYLNRALENIEDVNPTSKTAISIQTNLGHTYKRLGENERAIKCFRFILEDSERDSDCCCTLGYLYLKTNQIEKAIDYLHKALAIRPSNKNATELLTRALELNISLTVNDDHPILIRANFDNSIKEIDNHISVHDKELNPFRYARYFVKKDKYDTKVMKQIKGRRQRDLPEITSQAWRRNSEKRKKTIRSESNSNFMLNFFGEEESDSDGEMLDIE